ncbi:unnamed protein product [Meganyctiphanes norvegica]|uniref:Ion transport domain-containing protein n=1 Tax=Meganyctiphanes norvegica TaxID=48144 RepID=A0AAV2QIN4_MEGNR
MKYKHEDNTLISIESGTYSQNMPVQEMISVTLLTTVQCGCNEVTLVEQLDQLLSQSDQSYDLNHVYNEDPVNGTLLHLVTRKNLPQVARLLITKGADPDARDLNGDKYCPLHYAAEMGHYSMVEALLDGGANPNSTEGTFGRSALHLLLNQGRWNTNEEHYNKSVEEFLKNPEIIDVDIEDKDLETPLSMACFQNWQYFAKQLILKGSTIHSENFNTEQDKDILLTYNNLLSSIENDPNFYKTRKINIEKKYNNFHRELKKSMNSSTFNDFQKTISEIKMTKTEEEIKSIINSEENQGKTLLQYACDNNLTDFVDVLLNQRADPLRFDRTNKYSPMLYATSKGFAKILRILTCKMIADDTLSVGLLMTDKRGENVLHKVVKQEYKCDKANYFECLKILLEFESEIVEIIDMRDNSENTPLHYAAVLNDQNFSRLLVVNGAHLGLKNAHGKLAISNIQASIIKDGLNHCIRILNSNKTGTIGIQDLEIHLSYSRLIGDKDDETACIQYMSKSETHCHLLCHPIINTFLSLKWQRIQKYYIAYFIIYLFFLAFLTTFILCLHQREIQQESHIHVPNNDTNVESEIEQNKCLSNIIMLIIIMLLIAIITVILAIKSIILLLISRGYFFTSFKNILELAIIVMTTMLLLLSFNVNKHPTLSVWLILCSWINFILILGCHPKLAIYITMFKKVSQNFIKFIVLFSCMILAFSFSFYLVFQFDEEFMTIHQTILRTIIMTTGELEFTSLPFHGFPNASRILFTLFVVFIILVLMNFITGLAVSDITIIQQEAEIYSYKTQVELICHLESVFLIGTLPIYNKLSFKKSATIKRLLKGLLLFPSCLKKDKIKAFPNQKRRCHISCKTVLRLFLGVLPTQQCEVQCTCSKLHVFDLDQPQIDAALAVVLSEKDIMDRLNEMEEAASQHRSNIEERMAGLERALQNVTNPK